LTGGGLYLFVTPDESRPGNAASKPWRMGYRFHSRQKTYSIGPYGSGKDGTFSLADARRERDKAKDLLKAKTRAPRSSSTSTGWRPPGLSSNGPSKEYFQKNPAPAEYPAQSAAWWRANLFPKVLPETAAHVRRGQSVLGPPSLRHLFAGHGIANDRKSFLADLATRRHNTVFRNTSSRFGRPARISQSQRAGATGGSDLLFVLVRGAFLLFGFVRRYGRRRGSLA
jgi:hypothetical protein